MGNRPEKIFVTPEPFEGHEIWDGCPLVDIENGEGVEFIRADVVREAMPDQIDILRAIKKSGARKHGEIAKVISEMLTLTPKEDLK